MCMPDEARERLAAVQHEIWAHWMRYLFSCGSRVWGGDFLLPLDKVERWLRQMETPYSELSEQERESDRHQANKVFAVLDAQLAAPEPDWTQAPDDAMWYCVNPTGMRAWHVNQPKVVWDCWLSPAAYPDRNGEVLGGRIDLPLGVDWRTTLRKRPEATND